MVASVGVSACSAKQNKVAEPEPFTGGERVLWGAEGDITGDGVSEEIVVSSEEVLASVGELREDEQINIPFNNCAPGENKICDGELRVGTATLPLKLHSGYFGGLGVRVIDIDKSDKQRELLLSQRLDGEREDPPYQFWVVIYDGNKLNQIPIWHSGGYNSGEVKLDGKGTLRVIYSECPDRTSIDYTLSGKTLKAGEKETKRLKDPATCAG